MLSRLSSIFNPPLQPNKIIYNGTVYTKQIMCSNKALVEILKGANKLNPSVDTSEYIIDCANENIYEVNELELIGEGGNNTVYSLKGDKYNDKVIRISTIERNDLRDIKLIRELSGLFLQNYISNICPHICIIHEFGYLISSSNNVRVYSIIEKLVEPDLHGIIFGNKPTYKNRIYNYKIIIFQVLNALKCMNKHNFVHLDIKLENIGIDIDGNAKLFDFEFARYLAEECLTNQTTNGTKGFIAPEIYTKKICLNSDVYSLGYTLYLLYFVDDISIPDDIFDPEYDERDLDIDSSEFERYRFDGIVDENSKIEDTENLKVLIKNMMEHDPEQRYTIEQVLNHEWFNTKPKTAKKSVAKSAKKPVKPVKPSAKKPVKPSAKKQERGGKSVKKTKTHKNKKRNHKKTI